MNVRLLTLCLSCLLVISCGGGGGSSSDSPNNNTGGGGTPTTNSAPTVADISDISLISDGSSSLTAVGSDSEGDSLTYTWQQSGGDSPLVLTTGDGGALTVTAPTVSVATPYTLSVTVSDGSLTASATLTVTVNPPVNTAPTIDALTTVELVSAGNSTITPSISDAEEDTLTYEWTQAANTAEALTLVTGANGSVTVTAPEVTEVTTYSLTLSVSDGELSTDTSVTVSVSPPPNNAPVVNVVSELALSEGESAFLVAAAVDVDEDPITYAWSVTTGEADNVTLVDGDNGSLKVTAGSVEEITELVLTVTANDGTDDGTSNVNVTINPPAPSNPIKIIDDYIANALICADRNDNRKCESEEVIGESADDGTFVVTEENLDYVILAKVIAGYSSDSGSFGSYVSQTYTMAAYKGEQYVTPFTTLAVATNKTVEEVIDDAGIDEETKQAILKGDYIEGKQEAEAGTEEDQKFVTISVHNIARSIVDALPENIEDVTEQVVNLVKDIHEKNEAFKDTPDVLDKKDWKRDEAGELETVRATSDLESFFVDVGTLSLGSINRQLLEEEGFERIEVAEDGSIESYTEDGTLNFQSAITYDNAEGNLIDEDGEGLHVLAAFNNFLIATPIVSEGPRGAELMALFEGNVQDPTFEFGTFSTDTFSGKHWALLFDVDDGGDPGMDDDMPDPDAEEADSITTETPDDMPDDMTGDMPDDMAGDMDGSMDDEGEVRPHPMIFDMAFAAIADGETSGTFTVDLEENQNATGRFEISTVTTDWGEHSSLSFILDDDGDDGDDGFTYIMLAETESAILLYETNSDAIHFLTNDMAIIEGFVKEWETNELIQFNSLADYFQSGTVMSLGSMNPSAVSEDGLAKLVFDGDSVSFFNEAGELEDTLTVMLDEEALTISDNEGGGMEFVGIFPDFALGMPKDADEPRLDVLVRGDLLSDAYDFRPMHPRRFENSEWFIMVDEGIDEDDEIDADTDTTDGSADMGADMRANLQIYHPKLGALDDSGMSGELTVEIDGVEQTGTYSFGIDVTDFGAADSLTLTLEDEDGEEDPWTLVLVADDGHVMLFMDVSTHTFVIMTRDRWFLNDMSRLIPHYHPDHGGEDDGENNGDMDGGPSDGPGEGGDGVDDGGMAFEEDPDLVAYFSDGKTLSQSFGMDEFEVLVFGDRSVLIYDAEGNALESLDLMYDKNAYAIRDENDGMFKILGLYDDFVLGVSQSPDTIGELSVMLEGNFYDDFTPVPLSIDTFAGETWHLFINDVPDEGQDMEGSVTEDMPEGELPDGDVLDDVMPDDDMPDGEMPEDDMSDGDMMDDDMLDDEQVIFEISFNALEDGASTGTFTSSIEGEMATGTTSNTEITVAGKLLPALTLALESDDPDDTPLSLAVLKQTDELIVLIDGETGALHLMAKSQELLEEMVEQMFMAAHNGDGGHHGNDGDYSDDDNHNGGVLDLDEMQPDADLANYFNDQGTFTVVDGDGPLTLSFANGMISFTGEDGIEQDAVFFETDEFSIIRVENEAPLRLLPLYDQFAAGLILEDGEVELDVLIKGDITSDTFAFPDVTVSDLASKTYYLWDNTSEQYDEEVDDGFNDGFDDAIDGEMDEGMENGSETDDTTSPVVPGRQKGNVLNLRADDELETDDEVEGEVEGENDQDNGYDEYPDHMSDEHNGHHSPFDFITIMFAEATDDTGTFEATAEDESIAGTYSVAVQDTPLGQRSVISLITVDGDEQEVFSFVALVAEDDIWVIWDVDTNDIHMMTSSEDRVDTWKEWITELVGSNNMIGDHNDEGGAGYGDDYGDGDYGDMPDGDMPDGDMTDDDMPDGDMPDDDMPDGDMPDGDMPDGDMPDGDMPDDEMPDGDIIDDVVVDEPTIDDSIPSVITNDQTYNNNLLADHWTGYNLAGSGLDVMRLSVSDNAGGDGANFIKVTSWLADNPEWRYATEQEMQAIADFFKDQPGAFVEFNDGQWSPKANSEEWTALVPTESQNEGDNSPAYGVRFNPNSVGNVSYRPNFNAGADGAAALLIRVHEME